MEIREELRKMPFLRLLVPLLLGIVTAVRFDLSLPGIFTALFCGLLLYLFFRKENIRHALLFTAVFLAGQAAVRIHGLPEGLPYGERLVFTGEVTDYGYEKERWDRTDLKMRAYRVEQDSAGGWTNVSIKVFLCVDTCYTVGVGDRISAIGYLNPLDTIGGTSGFARTMASRGYAGIVFLTPGRLLRQDASVPETVTGRLALRSKKIRHGMVRTIGSSSMAPDQKAVAAALLAGDKRMIDPELRSDYSVTGAAHILAVSGLHLGIIFLILNSLTAPLALLRHGKWYAAAAIIGSLWLFAFVSGSSASVLRAALMFSLLQVSWTTSGRYHSYNALFASAFILLAVRPGFLYDISFQLSYLALGGYFSSTRG